MRDERCTTVVLLAIEDFLLISTVLLHLRIPSIEEYSSIEVYRHLDTSISDMKVYDTVPVTFYLCVIRIY